MSDSDAPASSTKATKPAPKPHRWRRRLVIGLIVFIAVVAILRVILVVALPPVLRSVAARYDLDCKYERTEMYLISGNVGVWHFALTPKGGGEPLLAADYLRADISAINLLRGKLVAYHVEGDGVDLLIDRDEKGEFPLLKQFLVSSTSASPAANTVAASTTPTDINLDSPLRIDSFRGGRVRAHLRDRSVTPALDTKFDVNVRLVDLGSPLRPTRFDLMATSPELLDMATIEGVGSARGKSVDARMTVNVRGIHPKPAAGYLAALGLRPSGDSVSMRMMATVKTQPVEGAPGAPPPAGLKGEIVLSDMTVHSDGAEAAALEKLSVGIKSLTPQRIGLGTIRIENVRASAMRTKEGALRVAGIDLVGAPQTAPPSGSVPLPPWSVEELNISNVKAEFRDEAVTPAAALAVVVDRIGAKHLASDASQIPTDLTVQMSVPGVAKSVQVNGAALPLAAKKALKLHVTADGVRPDALRPYLDALGLESQLENGRFTCDFHASLEQVAGGKIAVETKLGNVKFVDGDAELFNFAGVTLAGAEIDPQANRVRLGSIDIVGPALFISKDASGAIGAWGFVQKPAAARATGNVTPASATVAATTRPKANVTASLPRIELERLTWKGASVRFDDRSVSPPVTTTVGDVVGVELKNLVFDPKATPAPGNVQAWVAIPGVDGKVMVNGTIAPSAAALAVELDVKGENLKRAADTSLLAALGIEPELRDGSVQAHVKLGIAQPNGEWRADVAVSDVKYADAGQTLAGLDHLRIGAATLKPDGIAVDDVSVGGVEADIRKSADGRLHAMGIAIGGSPAAKTPAAPATQSVAATPTGSSPAATTNVAELVAKERATPPLITLKKLDVNVRKVSFADATRAESAPIALADVNVRNRKPIELLGPDAQSRPPTELDITGRIDPIVQAFTVAATAAPFASQPTLTLDIRAAGIKGDGLIAIVPELKPHVDGSSLTDGRFKMHMEASARFSRRGLGRYDFGKPFDAEFTIGGLEFRAAEDGDVLAGLEEVRGEGIHVDPASGRVNVGTLEITKPIARVWRDEQGVHAMGVVVKLPAEGGRTQSTAAQLVAAEIPAAPASATLTSSGKSGAELNINKLLVSGIDFKAEDRTTDPSLLVPLNNLEVEIRNLSSRALEEDRPVRFSVQASAGKVPLPDKGERELFSEFTANGNLSVYPKPRGWAKSSVSGFEMLALRGPAKAQGVEIDNGVFDGTFDLRFEDEGNLDARARLAVTDLKISEGPNGYLQRTLKLPAPLDVVIVVMQDASGTITVPLHVPIREGEISTGAVTASATGAFAGITATALASSPFKIAGGVTSAVGLGGPEKETGARPAGQIAFAAADSQLPPEAHTQIKATIEQMRRQGWLQVTLKHELGPEDMKRAAVLANPPAEDCVAIAEQIRDRKRQLSQLRRDRATIARAQLASGAIDEGQQSVDKLRAIDRELAAADDALDRVYELLRPGAERQAERRARAAALGIAQQRLEAVRAALVATGWKELDQRIRVTRAQLGEGDRTDGAGKVTFTVLEKKNP